jgi:hypothetical protein
MLEITRGTPAQLSFCTAFRVSGKIIATAPSRGGGRDRRRRLSRFFLTDDNWAELTHRPRLPWNCSRRAPRLCSWTAQRN